MLEYIRPGSLWGYFGLCSLGGNNGLDLAGLPLLCGFYHFEPRLDLLKNL